MDQWKVAVLGDVGVGKTTLAVTSYDPALEEPPYRKQLVVDNKMCFIEVIDTAGQEESAALRDQCIRDGEGFVLVYSITSRATFDRLEVFRQIIRVTQTKPTFMLVGNKCDKADEREVSREEGLAMARAFGCEFLETSGKTGQNVDRLFTSLIRMLRSAKQLAEQGPPVAGGKPKKAKGKNCIVV